jgi:nanoRNase/pAp phosphatase (c-di-AMP/oligoRNAs hydrolase)
MLKYDQQLSEVKSRLSSAKRILIVLSQNLNTDNLAAGLALSLSLKSAGKMVDIVSTGTPLVSHSNLFGIGEVKNHAAKSGAGNFIISLDGVVDTTGTMQQVPALEKLDWYPEGSKLNLVFHVVPGQRFEPTNISSRHEETGYDLTFVIGCQNLNELGDLFISNSQYFAQSQVINIDNNQTNGLFGFANIIDAQASSLSEIIAQILPSLTLNLDRDMASNIISGIYASTNNLTQKVNADTFMVVSQAVQVGGVLPNLSQPAQVQPIAQPEPQLPQPVAVTPAPAPQPAAENYQQPVITQPQYEPQPPVQPEPQAQPSLEGSPFIVAPQDINIPLPVYQPPAQPDSQPQPQFQFSQPQQPVQSAPVIPQANSQGFDLRQIFQNPQMAANAVPASSQSIDVAPVPTVEQIYQPTGGHHEQEPQLYADPKPVEPQPSAEERPVGEIAQSPNPEVESTPTPDWLVPKIFKGGNLG